MLRKKSRHNPLWQWKFAHNHFKTFPFFNPAWHGGVALLRHAFPRHTSIPSKVTMKIERRIPFPMSQKMESSFLGASKMSSFATLPELNRDRAIAKFLRHRRPDLFNMNFLGDFLIWTLGAPIPGSCPENGSTAKTVDLRMSPHLHRAVQRIACGMDYTATPDPTWSAVLRLRSSNEEVFDFCTVADGLAYFLASLELQAQPE